MPKRRKVNKDEQVGVLELWRGPMESLYTCILYDWWQGEDPTDPAVEVTRHMALFRPGEDPTDVEAAVVEAVLATSSSYWHGYEGLPNAVIDTEVEITKEKDEDAEEHERDSNNLVDRSRHRHSSTAEEEPTEYEEFMAAIDKVAENENDEEAWAVIDAWRLKQIPYDKR